MYVKDVWEGWSNAGAESDSRGLSGMRIIVHFLLKQLVVLADYMDGVFHG